jgi:DNA replication protein DnaC
MPEITCKLCNNSGYISEQKDIAARKFGSYCTCSIGQQEHKKGWEAKLAEMGILKDYFNIHFGNFQAQNQFPKQLMFIKDIEYYLKNITKKREEGSPWLIYGPTGTGKTLGASLILKQAYKQGYTIKYTIWTDLIDAVFDDELLITKLREVDFLVIDDFGRDKVAKESKFIEDLLEKIIKYRYSDKRPTILISSIDYTELRRRFSVIPSLIGPNSISQVDGINFRLQLKK